MTGASLVPLAGSARGPAEGLQPAGAVDPNERIGVTLITRRAANLPRTHDGFLGRLSREDLRLRHGGHAADHDLIARVMTGLDPAIEVTSDDPGARRITLAGPAGVLAGCLWYLAQLGNQPWTGRQAGHSPVPHWAPAHPG